MSVFAERFGQRLQGLPVKSWDTPQGYPAITPLEHHNAQAPQQFLLNQTLPMTNYNFRSTTTNQNYIGMRTLVPSTQTNANTYHPSYTNPLGPEEPYLRNIAGFVQPQFSSYA